MERKKAIVTGAALGMGRGISTVLAEEGYDIAFSYYPGTYRKVDDSADAPRTIQPSAMARL